MRRPDYLASLLLSGVAACAPGNSGGCAGRPPESPAAVSPEPTAPELIPEERWQATLEDTKTQLSLLAHERKIIFSSEHPFVDGVSGIPNDNFHTNLEAAIQAIANGDYQAARGPLTKAYLMLPTLREHPATSDYWREADKELDRNIKLLEAVRSAVEIKWQAQQPKSLSR